MGSFERVFVTGGTGLIGRAVLERLLRRGAQVTMMLRSGAEERRLDEIAALQSIARASEASLTSVTGDIEQDGLGLNGEGRSALADATHCFHLAALYDVEAPAEALLDANVEGTRRLLATLREVGFTGRLHHTSSIAVAGDYTGQFTESMLNEGQGFPHAYHQSKLESEVLVRDSGFDYRVYRPGSVVGDSRTGEIDRIDGVYYGFRAIQRLAYLFPRWARIPVPRIRGGFNLVPVDYVADAMVHIAFAETDARIFHLVDPKPLSFLRMTNLFLGAAGGPRLGPAILIPRMAAAKQAGAALGMLPSVGELRDAYLTELGLPVNGLTAMNLSVRFDDSHTREALRGSGIACPPLKSYAKVLYRYYEDHLDPAKQRPLRYRRFLDRKNVLVTGASRGIGAETARMAARAGAKVLLVARDLETLEKLAAEIREAGGEAHVHPADLSSFDQIDGLAASVLEQHGGVDVLIHNAARSIRRPIAASLDRFHDYERTMGLNYFAAVRLTLRLLPSLLERRGSISHVLTMGVLIPGPYFAAYLASKAALDAFGDTLAAELQHEGLNVSSVYLPLVKTEMMAPVKEYEGRLDVMTPQTAATMILDGIVDRKRRVATPLGAFYAISNRFTPASTTRFLNLIQRAFPVGDVPSEFPLEKAMITKAIGGSPI